MKIKLNNDLFETKALFINDGNIIINNKKVSIDKINIVIHDDFEVKISNVYSNVLKINKKYKIKNYQIAILDDFNNMEVKIEHNGEKILKIEINIGFIFLRDYSEDELLVFLSHEIGHIIDVDFLLRKIKYLNFFKKISKLFLFVIPFYYYFIFGLNNYFQIKLLSLMVAYSLLHRFVYSMYDSFLKRMQEYNADSNAVNIIGDVSIVISALQTLQHESNDFRERSSLFSSHPSLIQRINFLKMKYFYHYILKFFKIM